MERLMDIWLIRTDQAHRAALAAIDACWGAAEGTEDGPKLDVLTAFADASAALLDRPLSRATQHERADKTEHPDVHLAFFHASSART
jgi:hypothetical protein